MITKLARRTASCGGVVSLAVLLGSTSCGGNAAAPDEGGLTANLQSQTGPASTMAAPGALDPQPGPMGSLIPKPGASSPLAGGAFILEPNKAGGAASLRLVEMAWGRLVDVYDTVLAPGVTQAQYERDPLDPDLYTMRLVLPDLVIGEGVRTAFESGQLLWELSTQPVLGEPRLRIGLDALAQPGLFAQRLDEVTVGLESVAPASVSPTALPDLSILPTSTVPRNAALTVRFDDLLDPATVLADSTVKVLVGDQLGVPFQARILPDPNYGGIANGQFAPTRLIVDFTITPEEQMTLPYVAAPNAVGLPAGDEASGVNVAIAFPTALAPAAGQFSLLTNLAGSSLDPGSSGPLDPTSPSFDVSWGLQSGGPNQPANGFLSDDIEPRVVGSQPVTIVSAAASNASLELRLILTSTATPCLFPPSRGDLLRVGDAYFVEVVEVLHYAGPNDIVVRVEVPFGVTPIAPADLAGAVARYETFWRPSLGVASAPCFVDFVPQVGQLPASVVDPDAQVLVRFNEAIDPASARPFDSFYVARSADIDASLAEPVAGSTVQPPLPGDLVLGDTLSSADLREVVFAPTLPLTHVAGQAEQYFFNLFSDELGGGVADLAGNTLFDPLPIVPFSLDPSAADQDTGGWVLRFNTVDEDQLPGLEVRGQVLFDLALGQVHPRPVQRFSAVIDRNQPVVGAMQAIPSGLQTPLSALGSKAHLLWRYMDAGFDVSQTDALFYDLDVEGLALAPIAGQVVSEVYPEFEISLGHGARLPDETVDPNFLLPKYPTSGFTLGGSFASNFLQDPLAGPTVVHPRSLGFAVSAGDVFQSATGTSMLPMPWNQGLAEGEKTFFNWRNTTVQTRGSTIGGNLVGAGVPTEKELMVQGASSPSPGDVFGNSIHDSLGVPTPVGIPTPGLPLLMEYRCYPTDAMGLNSFDVSIAVSSSPRPYFRAFSTGGQNTGGLLVAKDPDLEVFPSGGFNTNPAVAPLGASTAPRDPSVYLGQMDIVIRTSRAFTILMDAEQLPSIDLGQGAYAYTPVVEPAPQDQPVGTALVFAWRGADAASPSTYPAMYDAGRLDVFGEPIVGPINSGIPIAEEHQFPWADPTWHDDITGVAGRRFVQSRVTFVANTATDHTPVLDSYGLAFTR
ncbi:Ig-like domain-containing protein [Engelhardtia mirabilis]|uniref:SbsA Ig-like domain-containing protein n=1 Tax=Engelhardtia mirabilis TaxID=2528011 RepID=A0A518BP83_9BACT|nr:hypothetical protein Pla133_38910 [Planctomycetes bacterium Pla133]QDV03115.1 hypothetical protein Pla86_38900 [Planctomycetes bacterium Pla86]